MTSEPKSQHRGALQNIPYALTCDLLRLVFVLQRRGTIHRAPLCNRGVIAKFCQIKWRNDPALSSHGARITAHGSRPSCFILVSPPVAQALLPARFSSLNRRGALPRVPRFRLLALNFEPLPRITGHAPFALAHTSRNILALLFPYLVTSIPPCFVSSLPLTPLPPQHTIAPARILRRDSISHQGATQ
jgi:hypothetical protein